MHGGSVHLRFADYNYKLVVGDYSEEESCNKARDEKVRCSNQ